MEWIIGISLSLIVLFCISTYFIIKWHDKVKEDTIKRAIDGGCPFFINNNKEENK